MSWITSIKRPWRSTLILMGLALLIPTTGPSQFEVERASELPAAQRLERVQAIAQAMAERAPKLSAMDQWALSLTLDRLCQKQHLDPFLILSIIAVESQFQPEAVSLAGARGLMQIRPFVADGLTDHNVGRDNDLHEMTHNVLLGTAYFQQLMQRFDHNPTVALAAYNQGPTRISSMLRSGKPLPLDYPRKVLKIYNQLTSAEI